VAKPLTRFAYDERLRDHARGQLASFERIAQPLGDLKAAAVAVVLSSYDGLGSVLLTRRAKSLRAHSGQWALPGGRLDPGESATDAALRELEEEVNLILPASSILGVLDDYITRSGFRITPVVVWADRDTGGLKPNPSEVASIHSATFSDLAKDHVAKFHVNSDEGTEILSLQLTLDQIFAPTAAVLYQFREVVLMGRDTRVAHYDQPPFAWR
jgi:8-oxo-dGTP pyrophosphatase MutT (NUDIX family)